MLRVWCTTVTHIIAPSNRPWWRGTRVSRVTRPTHTRRGDVAGQGAGRQLCKLTAVPQRIRLGTHTGTSTTTKVASKIAPGKQIQNQSHASYTNAPFREVCCSFPSNHPQVLTRERDTGKMLTGWLILKARSGRFPASGSLGFQKGQWAHRAWIWWPEPEKAGSMSQEKGKLESGYCIVCAKPRLD